MEIKLDNGKIETFEVRYHKFSLRLRPMTLLMQMIQTNRPVIENPPGSGL